MKFKLEASFITICQKIIEENLTPDQWDEISSSDMFQEGNYVGGYEGAESAFTFSYFDSGNEYWFQMQMSEIHRVAKGELHEIEMSQSED